MGTTIQGERLKECLKEKNITQVTLAKEANYSVQHISNIIRGVRGMSIEAAQAFSEILDVLPDYLLGKCDYKRNSEYQKTEYDDLEKRCDIINDFLAMNGLYLSRLLFYSNDNTVFAINPVLICNPHINSIEHLLGKQLINGSEEIIKSVELYAFTNSGKEILLDINRFFLTVSEILDYSNYLCRKLQRKSTLNSKNPNSR